MTAFYVLIGVLTVLAGMFVYADARGWDPFPRLYGTDPRELVDRAHEWGADDRTAELATRLIDRAEVLLRERGRS